MRRRKGGTYSETNRSAAHTDDLFVLSTQMFIAVLSRQLWEIYSVLLRGGLTQVRGPSSSAANLIFDASALSQSFR